jgi:hypothetical protein
MQAESWVDTAIGILGMTPREAARAGGKARAELEMLVDDLDWHHPPDGVLRLRIAVAGGSGEHRHLGLARAQLDAVRVNSASCGVSGAASTSG